MLGIVESYFSVLMLFGASQAVAGIFMLLMPKQRPFSNYLLILLLFMWGFSCYWFFAFIQKKPFFNVKVTSLIGPMLALTLFPPVYLFVKYLFYNHQRFQRIDHLHFLPIYAYLLFTMYLLIDSDFSILAMRQHPWYRPRMLAASYLATFLGPFYFYMTARILKKRQRLLEAEYSEIENLKLRWFQIINYSFALVFIIGGASTIVNFYVNPYILYMTYHAVIAVCLFYITLMIFKYPMLFEVESATPLVLPAEHSTEMSLADVEEELPAPHLETIPQKEGLIIAKLEAVMAKEQLYKNPNFSLNDLSQAISESRNAISSTLNNSLNKTFYQYINELRIEECKRLLADSSLAHYTIEGIAVESGFKTMSVFYKFFKEKEEVTPSVFRKNAGL